MADYNGNPTGGLGVGHGDAVVFGPTTDGLGGLRWLEKTDALRQQRDARAQAAAQKVKQTQDRDLLNKVRLNSDGGVHYGPALQQKRQEFYDGLEKVATDPTRSWYQKSWDIQRMKDDYNAEVDAGKKNDKFITDEVQRHHGDTRYDAPATTQLLTDTLYQKNPDGSLVVGQDGKPQLVPALAWDPRTAAAAITTGNAHIKAPELFSQFIDKLPEDSITTSKEPLQGGRGYRTVSKSNVFELDDQGIKRDKNGKRILKNTYETLAAFDADPLQKQYLDAEEAKHRQVFAGAVEKMQNLQQLSPEEAEAVRVEQSPQGRRLETLSKALVQYGYGREEHHLLQKAARAPRTTAAAKAPKFSEEGGTSFGPEVVGGTGTQGTAGLLSLSSSDPLFRVKADGTRVPHSARLVHRQYNLLQNGQPGRLVSNNAAPQSLDYIKPQLHVTTQDGRVLTPKDPTLEQRYQQGDRQPLLNWVRTQRENDPTTRLKWHFLAVPSHDKLTAENGAEAIFQRLQKEQEQAQKNPGDPGYQGAEKLHRTAQQLASQQGASLLVPYEGDDLRAIDGATGYTMRNPTRRKRMQTEFDYFNRETTPRPTEQRDAPKKKIGVDFGASSPTAAPVAPATPTFKRAGTKKTGISF